MKRLLFIILILNICISAQERLFDVDYAKFKNNDTTGFIEFYYSIYKNNLTSVEDDTSRFTNAVLSILIKESETDDVYVNRKYKINSPVDEEGKNSLLSGVLGFAFPINKYSATFIVKDKNKEDLVDSVRFEFSLEGFPDERFSVSDIQLANSIKQSSNEKSVFYKNTLEIIPNPSALFGKNLPVVFFYAEIYNIDYKAVSEYLKIDHILLNAKDEIKYSKEKFITRTNQDVVEAGVINISKMPTGAYTLVLGVTDTLQGTTIASTKRLFIYNPEIVDSQINRTEGLDFIASEYASMSEEEVEYIFSVSKYIAVAKDIDTWDNLKTLDEKRNFLYNFWRIRDDVPETQKNESKIEYFKRVEKANTRFGNIQTEGWKTDRGRVLLLYGEPSEIDRYPSATETKPYEVWEYNEIEGGVIFVFADLGGFNNYQLLHSTKRGEIYDDQWMRRIQITR